jgi:uncharacterized membrane protein YcaP (DUF421 family)
MAGQRVTEAEIYAAIRAQGLANLDQVEAVVLETDASFTVLRRPESGPASALAHVANYSGTAPGG